MGAEEVYNDRSRDDLMDFTLLSFSEDINITLALTQQLKSIQSRNNYMKLSLCLFTTKLELTHTSREATRKSYACCHRAG